MKKYLNYSLAYAVAAMVGGVFYREFTKFNDFSGVTMLGKVHTHLFFLGMAMFLIVALFAKHYRLKERKTFRSFMVVYNLGLPLTVLMMVIRGTLQVMGTPLSSGLNGAISGMAGIGHILVAAGIILFIISLKQTAELEETNEKIS